MNTPDIDTEPGAEAAAFEHRPPTGYHRSHRRVALSRRIILGGASFALLHRLPLARPAVVAINLFFFMAAFHVVLFLLIPGHFNNSALGLAEFFMEISLVTGLTLPVLFWLIIFPLPAGTVWKLLHLIGFETVPIALFPLKYAVFLLFCAKGTYLVVPFIVFFLCSLPGIIYMIAIFSLMVARVSRSAAKDIRVWLWA